MGSVRPKGDYGTKASSYGACFASQRDALDGDASSISKKGRLLPIVQSIMFASLACESCIFKMDNLSPILIYAALCDAKHTR